MPVIFNEPLTFLQRMAEYLEYAPLLVRAAESSDPIERLEVSVLQFCYLIFIDWIVT